MTAGRFVTQHPGRVTAYQAFIPNPLPPDPPLDLKPVLRDLSTADRALARLDGVATTLPNPNLFLSMYLRHEATYSSQIEGTQSTLEDVLDAESRRRHPRSPNSDVDEIFNYVDTLDYGLKRIQELPLSLRLIREIHKELLKGVRGEDRMPGEFRKSQNWVGGANIETAAYVPPPPDEMNQALHDLERFLHRPANLPVLIHCALAHAQFETIHPFLDGNGRVGRLLITFQLCNEKVLQHPLLYLSYFFRVNRSEYYDRLQAIRTNSDWIGWVRFFLKGVAAVSEAATKTARAIHELREKLRADSKLTRIGNELVDQLFLMPLMDVNQARERVSCSYAQANNVFNQLERMDVLQETTGQRRNRRYRFSPYLDLFDKQALEAPPA